MKRACFSIVFLFSSCVYAFAGFSGFHGFVEFDGGIKVSDDQTKRDSYNILEERLQLKSAYYFEGENYLASKGATINCKTDFLLDEYYSGKTGVSLRELNLSLTPLDILDAKIGRQVLTWGTGDYLFVNDLFPKDYISFFIGRDDEYLKMPSDAFKVSFYPSFANIDFVAMIFEPNKTAKGDRLSFFDSFQGGIAGTISNRDLLEPPLQFSNNEYAMRIYRSIASNELALYYFRGFNKNPDSYKDQSRKQLFYRRLDVYGWSLRGPFASGIGSVEFGYYDSRNDRNGDNRLIENSSIKALLGYAKDLGNDLRVGFQYLYERRLDYDNYISSLVMGDYFWDKHRHLVTNRITKMYKNQTVMVSLFTFFSPSDRDGYLRPTVSYEMSDQWRVTLGANLAWGEDDITEFGQMRKNKNIFLRVRYSF
ncbi:hypothetical protein ACFL96_02590 [Thermoproteota archaeon]